MSAAEKLSAVMDDADGAVAELNKRYAVAVIGGRTAIIVERPDGYALWTKHAFMDFLANQTVWRDEKRVRLSTCFLEHDDTRRYSGITFAPGGAPIDVYNIWRGFSVEPAPGNWGTFRDHLLNNVCCGDENHLTWVMGWFAHMIQHPGEKIGTSLVLGGESAVAVAKNDPLAGLAIAEKISDPELRSQCIIDIGRDWYADDPGPATAWLEASELDNEQRERVVAPSKQGRRRGAR